LRRSAHGIAVDHGVAEYDRANTGGIEDKPVDRNARDSFGLGLNRRIFMEYAVRRLAHGLVGHDAAVAGVDKRLARAGKASDQCHDGAAVTAAGRVDEAIRRSGFGLQQRRVVERTDNRIDAVDRHRIGFGVVANEAANRVTVGDQSRGDRAADEAVRACEEDAHRRLFVIID
jgi:hypothetical protein